jgi:hypothetical protein
VDATIFACIAKQPDKLMFGTVENRRRPFRLDAEIAAALSIFISP